MVITIEYGLRSRLSEEMVLGTSHFPCIRGEPPLILRLRLVKVSLCNHLFLTLFIYIWTNIYMG